MPGEPISTEKTRNTSIVVGAINLCVSPLYLFDTRLGATASMLVTTATLCKLNEIGRSRRPGANFVNSANNFFAPYTGDPNTNADNIARNIVEGGDVVFNKILSLGSSNKS